MSFHAISRLMQAVSLISSILPGIPAFRDQDFRRIEDGHAGRILSHRARRGRNADAFLNIRRKKGALAFWHSASFYNRMHAMPVKTRRGSIKDTGRPDGRIR